MMSDKDAQRQLRRRNSFKNAIKQLLKEEYRFLGGERVQNLFVTDLMNLQDRYLKDASRLDAGQVVWWAVHKDDKPRRGQTLEQTRMIPVTLTLAAQEDVESVLQGNSLLEIRRHRVARLLQEAYEQGGVLAQSDLSLLMGTGVDSVSRDIRWYQKETGVVLPYRGTIHDLGPALTHKRLIVGLFLENVPTPEIARRTGHSLEACDRYIKAFKKVQKLFSDGMEAGNIAAELDMSRRLVAEYVELAREHDGEDPEAKESC